jgi:NADPH2:quinone reductase
MKAMLMTAVGGPEVLRFQETAKPDLPGPNYILVKVAAAGINPIDTKIRKMHMLYPNNLPAILGCDGAGTVEAVGKNVKRFRAGDEVYFYNGGLGGEPGSYAEYTTLHYEYAALKPKNITMIEAAAVPLVWITVWEALVDRAKLEESQTILIHGGAGGVGHVAIQLAKHIGAHIATTVSSEEKAKFVKSLGADFAIDYKQEDFVEDTLRWTDGAGADVVMDNIGGETFCRSFAATKVYGKVVSLLSTACELKYINQARMRNVSVCYEQMSAPAFFGMHGVRCAQRHILEKATELIERGELKVKVNKVLALKDAAQAHREIEEGHVSGKIVLKI